MKPLETDYYERWSDPDLVEKFASKNVDEFFRTEIWALDKTAGDFDSVLDIGCASGRMLELLKEYSDNLSYTGVDISADNIERGKALYPGSEFVLGNALDFQPQQTFSLVNATGVCQHEPDFESLVQHMVDLSHRFVMFDFKLAALEDHLIDRDRSYCQFGEHRLYYVLLALPRFLTFMSKLSGVSRVAVWGYDTNKSQRSTVPDGIERLVSAGVFIEKGDAPCELIVDLPEWIQATAES